MATFHAIPWLPEYVEMKRIEELLKCGICHDFIETAVMTPCSHNYCSLCIRKYLHYKTQCPACFQTTFEKDLHTNRILDEVIVHFVKIHSKLIDCVSNADKNTSSVDHFHVSSKSSRNSLSTTPHVSNDFCHRSSTSDAFENTKNSVVNSSILIAGTTDVSNGIFPSSIPGTSSGLLGMKGARVSNDSQLNNTQIPCPVCQVNISQIYINRHLDECIKRESLKKKSVPCIENSRKVLPKLVIHLMKDSELKKKMKQLNLPTQGDRRTLENRFQRYCTLYNAECDKQNPRTVAALLEQCKDEECIEKKLANSSSENTKLKVSRNAEQDVIDEVNNKYLRINAQSYQNLIESIRNRPKHQNPNDEAKMKHEYVMTCMHNDGQVRKCQSILPPNNSMTFDPS